MYIDIHVFVCVFVQSILPPNFSLEISTAPGPGNGPTAQRPEGPASGAAAAAAECAPPAAARPRRRPPGWRRPGGEPGC